MAPAQGLSFQHFSYIAQILDSKCIKAETATAAQMLVYIQFHNEENFVEGIYYASTNLQYTSPQISLYAFYTQIAMQPLQHFRGLRHRNMFMQTSLQLADVAMVFFLISQDHFYCTILVKLETAILNYIIQMYLLPMERAARSAKSYTTV